MNYRLPKNKNFHKTANEIYNYDYLDSKERDIIAFSNRHIAHFKLTRESIARFLKYSPDTTKKKLASLIRKRHCILVITKKIGPSGKLVYDKFVYWITDRRFEEDERHHIQEMLCETWGACDFPMRALPLEVDPLVEKPPMGKPFSKGQPLLYTYKTNKIKDYKQGGSSFQKSQEEETPILQTNSAISPIPLGKSPVRQGSDLAKQTLDLKPPVGHKTYSTRSSQAVNQLPCEEHLMFKGLGISDSQALSFIKSHSKDALAKATGVVRHYIDTGKEIKNSPTALLRTALERDWSPPEASRNQIDVMLIKTLFAFLKSHNQLLTNHFDVNSNSNSITFSFGTSQSSFNGNDKKEFAKWIYSSLKLIDSSLPTQKKLDPATGKWYAHKHEFANDWISFLNLKRHNDCGTSPDFRLRTSS